ncbi:MAG: malate synthase A [Alphaproteobacteria bacterium]|nr:MAG: malate synthase A [Alphaproteobacteria bacterium]
MTLASSHAAHVSSKLTLTLPVAEHYAAIYSKEALAFIEALADRFMPERDQLLATRKERQKAVDAEGSLDFRPETAHIRESAWSVAPIPHALQDRRVEITGPAEPKMIINALNSGAKVFMVDFEDSLSPTWEKIVEGQGALYDAVRHQLRYNSPEGKSYTLNNDIATLIVRPRGWHLPEKHVIYNGRPLAGALLDFGLFFFHNAHYQAERGTGPFFYLPKLEYYEEAAFWAKIFAFSEEYIGLPKGTIKATILIETISAVFQMHEILWHLKDYAVGLNCGRWDYIFSFVKKFNKHSEFMLPDRAQVTMTTHFLQSYAQLLIQTCHERGAFAMGGMAPQIPIKGDDAANQAALDKVRADKLREVTFGHDGTWVAHPGLIPTAMAVFNEHMPTPNQVDKARPAVHVTAEDLLRVPQGTITEAGLRNNVNVCIQYMASWMAGNGCVPIFNLMEDAATAEISRTQLWQWVHHEGTLEDGRVIDVLLLKRVIAEELKAIEAQVGSDVYAAGLYIPAAQMLEQQTLNADYVEFLTLPAYERLK